jgi:2'-5' RNA ligase
MARLFVAAWPDADTVAALRELPEATSAGERRVSPSNWHVTLRFVGEAHVAEVAALLEGAPLPRSTAVLGPRIERLDRRQVVVPVDGVDLLAAAVRRATIVVGESSRHRFAGHLTVARLGRGGRSDLVGVPFTASFVVAEVALVSSELTASGPVYSTVARFGTS